MSFTLPSTNNPSITPDTLEAIISTNNSIAAYLYENHPPSQWAIILELFLLVGFESWKSHSKSIPEDISIASLRKWYKKLQKDSTTNMKSSDSTIPPPTDAPETTTTNRSRPKKPKRSSSIQKTESTQESLSKKQPASTQQQKTRPKRTTVPVQKTTVGSVYQQRNTRPQKQQKVEKPKRRPSSAWDIEMKQQQQKRSSTSTSQRRNAKPSQKQLHHEDENGVPITPVYDKDEWMNTFEESRRAFEKNKEKNRAISPSWNANREARRGEARVAWGNASEQSEDESISPQPSRTRLSFSGQDHHNDILLRDLEPESSARKRASEAAHQQNPIRHHRSPRRTRNSAPYHSQQNRSADTSTILRDLDSETELMRMRRQRKATSRSRHSKVEASFARPTSSWKHHMTSPKKRSGSSQRRRPYQPVKFGLPYDVKHIESRIKPQVEFDKQYNKLMERQQRDEESEEIGGQETTGNFDDEYFEERPQSTGHRRKHGSLPTPEIYSSPPRKDRAPENTAKQEASRGEETQQSQLQQSSRSSVDASQILDNFFSEPYMQDFL